MSRRKIRRPSSPEPTTPRPPEAIRFLEGEEAILGWLRQGGVRTFRYRINRPGFIFLGILSFFAVLAAALLWRRSGLVLPIHWAGFTVLMAFTSWCTWTISRWTLFAHRHYIGLTDHEVLLGRSRTGLAIPRSRISSHTFGIDRMEKGRVSVSIPIEVEDHHDRIHLFGPFANLEFIEPFMEEMLHDLKRNAEDDDPESEASAAGERIEDGERAVHEGEPTS
ncbi:MAG: hypothetical protein EA398_04225 [Deltaproteobacteria bacterium]|nr:MAG: hypothetical protein EA398_04225 [Deltaproteobacteria bacterium]